jgi:hypothetical protein
MRTLVLALAVLSLAGLQTRPVTPFDPAGKWTYSTIDDQGAPISGTMEITGKPGAYTGTIVSGPDRTLQISDVLTSANGAVILANLPDGGVAVIKVWQGADGKLQGGWGPIRSVIPATVARGRGGGSRSPPTPPSAR